MSISRIMCVRAIENTVGSIPWGAISICLAAAIFTPSLVDYCVRRNLTRESGTHCAVSKLRKGRIWGEYLLGLRTVVQIALYEYASENSKNKTESGYFTFSTIVPL